jgi:hypothetical protein
VCESNIECSSTINKMYITYIGEDAIEGLMIKEGCRGTKKERKGRKRRR